MSGSLINPEAIPGTDLDPTQIAASATAYKSTAESIGTKADTVLADWAGLSGSYSAPESPQLLAAMGPVGTDSHAFADKLTTVAGLLDDLASAIEAPVRRLKELKKEAQDFVDSVKNGVKVDYYDPDNPLFQANAMSGAPAYVPEGQGDVTLNWSEHTPSVERNNELIEEVARETAKLLAASADCVNGINALRGDVCVAPAEAPSAQDLIDSKELPWGEIGKGDRSCSESVGDGLVEFGRGIFGGAAALVTGYDIETGDFSWDTAGKAWTGLASGLGALAVTVTPGVNVVLSLPEEWTPSWMHGAQDWYQGTMTNLVQGMVGSPEMWEEDPIAAGTFAAASIGSLFLPGLGEAGAATKTASALARTSSAVERLSALAADGSRLANGLARSGDLLARLGGTVDRFGNLLSGGGRSITDGIDGIDDAMRTLDDIPDVVPDNLNSHVGSDAPPVHAHTGSDSPVSVHDGSGHEGAATHSGGDTAVLEHPGHGSGGSSSGGHGGVDTGTGTGGGHGGVGGGDAAPGHGGDPVHPGADGGAGWTSGPDHRADPVDPNYSEPRPDHGTLDYAYAPPAVAPEPVRHLVDDPGAPYGRGADGHPFTKDEWQERYIGPDNRPIYPGNDGAVAGTRIEFTDPAAFRGTYGGTLDRMGGDGGSFLSFPDTPFGERALPGSNLNAPYSEFRLADDLPDGVRIEVSEVAPAFGQPGGGLQVRFLDGDTVLSVDDLLSDRYNVLERVEAPATGHVPASGTSFPDASSPAEFARPEHGSTVDLSAAEAPGSRTPFAARTDLAPDTMYHVEGRGDFYTDSTGKVTYVEANYGGRGSLNADLNHPQPNTTYVVHPDVVNPVDGASHAHVFQTDDAGRTVLAHTDQLALGHADRSESVQSRVGSEGGDGYDGGHLFGNDFGGGGEYANMAAMLRDVNRGAGNSFYNLENEWRSLLKGDAPARIELDIEPEYPAGSTVPDQFNVFYRVDGGTWIQRTFDNAG